MTELAQAAATAAAALSPDDGDGASDLVATAERAIAPVERLAPELAAAGDALRQAELQLRETRLRPQAFLSSLEAEPGRLEEVEAELEDLPDLRRRHRVQTYVELLERGDEARRELAALDEGHDPVAGGRSGAERAEAEVARIHAELRAARQAAAEPFAAAVASEVRGSASATASSRSSSRSATPAQRASTTSRS